MPSLHIGWSLWCAFAIVALAKRTWVRVLGALYPLATLFVIVGTANHYRARRGRRRRHARASRSASQRLISGRSTYRRPDDRAAPDRRRPRARHRLIAFPAMRHRVVRGGRGVSNTLHVKQLERELGVTYKTAWRMYHLIRNELMDAGLRAVRRQPVEMDESWFGGDPHAVRPRGLGPSHGEHLWQRASVSHLSRERQDRCVRHRGARRHVAALRREENVAVQTIYAYIDEAGSDRHTSSTPTTTSIYRRMDRRGLLDHRHQPQRRGLRHGRHPHADH